MGLRLTAIVTRTGDDGSTGLGDGSRTRKDSLRVTALGEVDELNSTIGLLITEPVPEPISAALSVIQHDLFDLGSELAVPGYEAIGERHVLQLDQWLAEHNATLPRLAEFILPGGSRMAALAHVARTVCRRAERSVVALAAEESIRPQAQQYLNRLSDLLFVLARVLNRAGGGEDVLWQPRRGETVTGSR
jgi:cob(I)alamin adenosyltransferase